MLRISGAAFAAMLFAAAGTSGFGAGTRVPSAGQVVDKLASEAARARPPQRAVSQAVALRAMHGPWGGPGGGQRRAAPGWTDRHARRVARKLRNQARHRAAGRGSRSRAT